MGVIWPDIKKTKLIVRALSGWRWAGGGAVAAAELTLSLMILTLARTGGPGLSGPPSLRLYLPLTGLVGSTKGAIRS